MITVNETSVAGGARFPLPRRPPGSFFASSDESLVLLGDEWKSGEHPRRRRVFKKCPGSFRKEEVGRRRLDAIVACPVCSPSGLFMKNEFLSLSAIVILDMLPSYRQTLLCASEGRPHGRL